MLLVMSAQAHTQSGRFIRVYLLTWGLLAACGLTYLASLAWHLDLHLPQGQQQAAQPLIDPEQGLRVAHRALVEVGSVQQTVGEIQKDLGRLKETVEQREAQDRESQSRLSSLEERVSSLATPPPANIVTVPPAKQKAAEKAKAVAEKRASEQRATSRIVSVVEGPTAIPEPPAAADTPAAKLETGSIPASSPPITFGDPEVTPVRQAYTVQLVTGPSLDALQMNWLALRDQYGDALGSLQPRFVAPRNGKGPYRLVAGPLTSKADADKVCADMRLGRDTCFATTAMGQPLPQL
jgi:sporulation related protein